MITRHVISINLIMDDQNTLDYSPRATMNSIMGLIDRIRHTNRLRNSNLYGELSATCECENRLRNAVTSSNQSLPRQVTAVGHPYLRDCRSPYPNIKPFNRYWVAQRRPEIPRAFAFQLTGVVALTFHVQRTRPKA